LIDSLCLLRYNSDGKKLLLVRGEMSLELFHAMRQSILEGDPEQCARLASQALEQGINPLDAINLGFLPGVNEVGEQFSRGEMFLPELVMAGEAMKAAVAILEPELARRGTQRRYLGKVVIGTIAGDIHEIGKTLVATMLSASGFQVHDLGVDVPVNDFVQQASQFNADIVGISALLTTTMVRQRDVILALQQAGLRPAVRVIVGGAPVTQAWADEIGADGYSQDAVGAVRLAKNLMGVS
jgi:corrinoid protein of di/trimethylamine methyltransferase